MARTVRQPGGNPASEPRAPRTTRARAESGTAQGVSGGSSAPQTPPPKLTPDERKIREALVQFYTMGGGFIQVRGQTSGDLGLATAGVNIHTRAGEAADMWVDLARQNSQVKKALQHLIAGGAVAGVIGVHAMMIVPVLSAQGMVRPEFGVMALNDDAKQHWVREAQAAAAREAAAQNGGGAQ
jgi:hypothetical protein